MLTQNQIYTALITDYTAQGQGVAHIEGCAVFVPNAIAGELCDIQITKAAGPAPRASFAVAVPFSTWTTRRSAA